MANYPEWVLAHKKKGTYVNKVGDKYYLYAAHSERIPGTKRVKRVCDGYLGRITEKDGLIPPKDKVTSPVISYEFGLSSLTLSVCANIHKGLRRTFVVHGDFVMAASILTFIFGIYSEEIFRHSWLSLHFSSIDFPQNLTLAQKNGIDRGTRMVADTMEHTFGPDLPSVKAAFSLVTLSLINRRLYCCSPPESVTLFVEKYHLDWRPEPWQK